MALVDVTRLANALEVGVRRVQQLAAEGLPKEERGRYDLGKCVLWYIRSLHAALQKKAVPVDGGFAGEGEERLRLLRADADLREIELAKQRNTLISIADHEGIVTDLVLTTKARIMAIPPRVSTEIVGETSRLMLQAKLEKAYKKALTYLAKQGEEIGNRHASKHGP